MDDNGSNATEKCRCCCGLLEIDRLVAEQKQPHTIAESLILPRAKILVKGRILPSSG